MTQQQFVRLCRLWQKRLRLQDWSVKAEIVPKEVPEHRHLAATEFGSTQIDFGEVAADMLVRENELTEATLVHELLHLRLLPFDYDDHEAKEVAINLLADCFLRAHPRRRKAE